MIVYETVCSILKFLIAVDSLTRPTADATTRLIILITKFNFESLILLHCRVDVLFFMLIKKRGKK